MTEEYVRKSDVVKVLTNNRVHFCDMVKITSEINSLDTFEFNDQESVIDKIKADIEKLDGMYVLKDHVFYAEKDLKHAGLWYIRLKEVIDILDEYKEEESEDKRTTEEQENTVWDVIKVLRAKPCEDCVSREAILDAFWKLDVELRPSAIDAITNMIDSLPSVTPKPRWIPVSERLPEKSMEVMACDESGTIFFAHFNNGYSFCEDAVAWMPLPAKYKEGESE